ncbi:MAG: hypothetical protein AAGJ10_12000 [Bacteroidota bacterium]
MNELNKPAGFAAVRDVCERAVQNITGSTVDALERKQAAARSALLSNAASLRAMHNQDWTRQAMRAFGDRFGVEDDDFVAVWDKPYGAQGPKCVCWRLNPAKFPKPQRSGKVYRLRGVTG